MEHEKNKGKRGAGSKHLVLWEEVKHLCVGEVAALRYCDVLEADGQIKAETTLTAAQTKGK